MRSNLDFDVFRKVCHDRTIAKDLESNVLVTAGSYYYTGMPLESVER